MKPCFKKILCLTLALLLVLPLCACSFLGPDNTAYVGKWICYTVYVDGTSINGSSIFTEGLILDLREDGTCTAHSAEITQDGTWTLALEDGQEVLTVQAGLLSASAAMPDPRKFVLEDVLKPGIDFAFTPFDGTATDAAVEEPPIESSAATEEDAAFWNGSWYGYILLHDTDGRYSGWANRYIPVCMRTELVESDLCRVLLWTDLPGADTEFFIDIAQNANAGVLATDAGGMFMGNKIPNIGWNFDFDRYEHCGAMVLHDAWADDADHSNDYAFTLAVCRWGTDVTSWEELLAAGEIDSLPPHFEDWYMLLVEAGEPMPEGPLHFDDSPEGDSDGPVMEEHVADIVAYGFLTNTDGTLRIQRVVHVDAATVEELDAAGISSEEILAGTRSDNTPFEDIVFTEAPTFAVLAGSNYLQDVPQEEFAAYAMEYTYAYGHIPVRMWLHNEAACRIEEISYTNQ